MNHREHAKHKWLADQFGARGLVHRPGLEGVLTRVQRIRMAQVGMRMGWPDVHLPAQRGRPAVWLELKDKGKRPTPEQFEVMAWLEAQGDLVRWSDDEVRLLAFVDEVYGL